MMIVILQYPHINIVVLMLVYGLKRAETPK